jgi:DNA-binding transcriptional regulator YbjK
VVFDVTLEYRIRELCAQAVAAQDTDELQPVLAELRHALREHLEQRRSMVAEYPFSRT